MIASWNAPSADGTTTEELVLKFDARRAKRVLVLPALFDEANKLRRFTVQMMRALDAAGIDSFAPDLPGCNESLSPLERQTLAGWSEAVLAASREFAATHVLSIRAGALLMPEGLPGWLYAPQTGAKLLRGMIRARTIAAREDGREEKSDQLMDLGRSEGLTLAGWQIGAEMLRELEAAQPRQRENQTEIAQSALGGPGLWLRAEPDEDAAQSETLATLISEDLATP